MSGSFLKWMAKHPDKVEHVRALGARELAGKGQSKASVSSGMSAADHSSEGSVGDEA
jgi:hypothetical protein